jgi:hypothetical protein
MGNLATELAKHTDVTAPNAPLTAPNTPVTAPNTLVIVRELVLPARNSFLERRGRRAESVGGSFHTPHVLRPNRNLVRKWTSEPGVWDTTRGRRRKSSERGRCMIGPRRVRGGSHAVTDRNLQRSDRACDGTDRRSTVRTALSTFTDVRGTVTGRSAHDVARLGLRSYWTLRILALFVSPM